MQKRLLPRLITAMAVLASCSCPPSYRDVPAPGRVVTLAQVKTLTKCQLKYYGATLLGQAETPELVQAMLLAGANPNGKIYVNGKEYDGGALALAKQPGIIAILAEAGADPNAQSGIDNSLPLCKAIRQGDTALALRLLAAGADPNVTDNSKETPLLTAASRLDLRLCQALVARGAMVDAGNIADGTTPLMAALKSGGIATSNPNKLAVAEFLLNSGANHLQADAQGNMPMHYAPVELMPLLMASGASTHCTNLKGRTPIFFGGGRQRLDFLLQQGADLNARDADGNTVFDTVGEPSLKAYILSLGGRSGKAL